MLELSKYWAYPSQSKSRYPSPVLSEQAKVDPECGSEYENIEEGCDGGVCYYWGDWKEDSQRDVE